MLPQVYHDKLKKYRKMQRNGSFAAKIVLSENNRIALQTEMTEQLVNVRMITGLDQHLYHT